MKSLTSLASLATTLAVAALLTACGGAENASSDSSTSSSTTTSATASESETRGTRALAADATTWAYCTWQGGTCTFNGTRQVRYGTATASITKTFTGKVLCVDSVFGDPAYGIPKTCWVANTAAATSTTTALQDSAATATTSTTTSPTATSTSTSTSWQYCTWQGGTCSFSGTREVRYGAGSSWYTKTVTSSVSCADAVFGDPAYGTAKHCELGAAASASVSVTSPVVKTTTSSSSSTTTTTSTAPSYSKTQMFALANPNIAVQAGQDIALKVRFYGAALPDQSKVFTHLYTTGNDNYLVADLVHHYEWVPTQSWSGYVEYDYVVNVPLSTSPGTYRIGSGLHQGVSPYVGRMDSVDCNGAARLSTSYGTSVQTCHVGMITVLAPSMARSTATDGPMSMFYVGPRSWSPLSL